MNTTIQVIGALMMLMIFSSTALAQSDSASRIGNVNNKIFLDKYENYYRLSYSDISMDSEGEMVSIRLIDEEVTELYQELKSSFSNKNSGPSVLSLQDAELRIYFKERPVKADYVEIIHEYMKTETTSTLPWITLKELDQLFSAVIK